MIDSLFLLYNFFVHLVEASCMEKAVMEGTTIIHEIAQKNSAKILSPENQKKLRMHLATQSTIIQDIMFPYVDNILPAL